MSIAKVIDSDLPDRDRKSQLFLISRSVDRHIDLKINIKDDISFFNE